MFSNSRKKKVNKKGEGKERERERWEKKRDRMKNVQRPQESVTKVVAVEARTGLMGTR